ncbi:sigma factor regulator VreR [Blastochloris viridis]|uniref:Sigma factor regulator VreR n=1 Tax=Blastochloris viridis TaxID=1079 RepID=A0A182D459_BLAVI|nr:sigma factor regulator VreR [Blastochloris viridis]
MTQLVSGEATAADADALKHWCNQSPAHQAAFAAAARRWKDFGPAGRDLLEQGHLPVWMPSPISRRAALGGAAAFAAGVAGYAVVQPPLGLWPSLHELTADYRTATGEQRRITVSNTVSVRMNTQTSIVIAAPPAVASSDEVKLVSGEASFALATDSHNYLVVHAGEGRTVASRARFDVRHLGSTVCVTCFEGAVRVERGAHVAMVGATQQVRYDDRGFHPVVSVDPVEAAAWQDGVLIFRLTPLSDVVAEINRYRPGKVILINTDLWMRPVNGRFRIQRIDEVLTWIELAFGATLRSLPGGIRLLS